MTKTEAETLAVLSERVHQMSRQLDQNTKDTAAIKSSVNELQISFANMSGGKQALMWFTGLIISIGLIVATWLGFHK